MDGSALTWNKREGEFAYCLEWDGSQDKTVVVPYGTQALFFHKEKLDKIFDAGVHQIGKDSSLFSFFGKKSVSGKVVFVDIADIDQSYIFKNIRCQENFCFDVSLALTTKLVQPALFHYHMMRDKNDYSLPNLKSAFFDEIRDAVSDFFKPLTFSEIRQNREFKDKLEQYLAGHIQHTFARHGFQLLHIRSLDYHSPQFDQLRDQQADYHMSLSQAELQKRREIEQIHMDDEIVQARDRVQIHSMIRDQEKQKVQRSWEQEDRDQRQDYEFSHCQKHIEQRYTLENMEVHFQHQVQQKKQHHHSDLERQRLEAEMRKQKLKAQIEREISEITMETQRKRAEAAMEIQRQRNMSETEMEAWRRSFLNSIPKAAP